MKKAMKNRTKFPLPRKASLTPRSSRAARSSSIATSISAISERTAGESTSSLRINARFSIASSLRPTDASHRGDSYRIKYRKLVGISAKKDAMSNKNNLYGEETEEHEPRGNELEGQWNPPYIFRVTEVQRRPH